MFYAMNESNETVKLLCRIQLCALELQIAYATGDLRRAHDVLYESPSCAQNVDLYGEKVVADRTSAVGVIHGNFRWHYCKHRTVAFPIV